jgi:hypothetical protein
LTERRQRKKKQEKGFKGKPIWEMAEMDQIMTGFGRRI